MPKIAVTTMTGRLLIRPSARSSRRTEKPSRLGIMRSSTMTDGERSSTSRIASSPSCASFASRPSSFSAVTALDRDDLAALEVAEHPVHRHARGADERGELVLRQGELGAVPGRTGEIEQVFRDAARDVEEDEVLDAVGEPSDRAREGLQ